MGVLEAARHKVTEIAVANFRDPFCTELTLRNSLEGLCATGQIKNPNIIKAAGAAIRHTYRDSKDPAETNHVQVAFESFSKIDHPAVLQELCATALFASQDSLRKLALDALVKYETPFIQCVRELAAENSAQEENAPHASSNKSNTDQTVAGRFLNTLDEVTLEYWDFKEYCLAALAEPQRNEPAALNALRIIDCFNDCDDDLVPILGKVLLRVVDDNNIYYLAAERLNAIGTPEAYAELMAASSFDNVANDDGITLFAAINLPEVVTMFPEAGSLALQIALNHPYGDVRDGARTAYETLNQPLSTSDATLIAEALAGKDDIVSVHDRTTIALSILDKKQVPASFGKALLSVVSDRERSLDMRTKAARLLSVMEHSDPEKFYSTVARLGVNEGEYPDDAILAVQCLEYVPTPAATRLLKRISLDAAYCAEEGQGIAALSALSLRSWEEVKEHFRLLASGVTHADSPIKEFALSQRLIHEPDSVISGLVQKINTTTGAHTPSWDATETAGIAIRSAAAVSRAMAEFVIDRLIQEDIRTDVIENLLSEVSLSGDCYRKLAETRGEEGLEQAETALHATIREAVTNILPESTILEIKRARGLLPPERAIEPATDQSIISRLWYRATPYLHALGRAFG